MKIALTLLVRDEFDVIQTMIDYHIKRGIDHFVITDNGSKDSTIEILNDFARSDQIMLLHEPPSDFSQHRWVTRMAHIAQDMFQADWIFHADADELFVPMGSRTIKEILLEVEEEIQVLKIDRHDFVAFNRKYYAPPQIEMIYRKSESLNLGGRPLPPKVIHRPIQNVKVTQGNHGIDVETNPRSASIDALRIYHYPIRSYKQFATKVSNGGSGYSLNKELPKNTGFHKRHWYQLLQDGKLEELFFAKYHYSDAEVKIALSEGIIVEDNTISQFIKCTL
jgi:hypothetical protein